MATVKINTAYNVNINFELSGIDKRFFAWLIDLVIRFLFLVILSAILHKIFGNNSDDFTENNERKAAISIAVMLPIMFYYFIFETFFNGQSIGKKLLNIRVVSLEGYKPTATQYLIRWCFRLVDLGFFSLIFLGQVGVFTNWALGLSFGIPSLFAIFYVLNSKKEQRLGDLASGTVVIKLKPSTHITDTIFENVSKEYNVQYNNVLKLSDRDVTIIKNALQNYEKSGNDTTIWLITQKLQQVLEIENISDPYDLLSTVLKDYNYLTSN